MKHEFDYKAFGKALKIKRTIELNMNLRDANKKAKVGIATLSRIENGGKADLDNVIRVCDWLNTPITTFIKKVNPKIK